MSENETRRQEHDASFTQENAAFDTDLTLDKDGGTGRLTIYVDLTEAESERVWKKISDGHRHPTDVRERTLEALAFDVCTVQSAGQSG